MALFLKHLFQANFKTLIKIDFTSLMYHVSTQHQQKMIFVELTLDALGGQKCQKKMLQIV